MNRFFISLLGLVTLLAVACNNDSPKAEEERPALTKEEQAALDNIKMLAPVTIEPQPIFDQSQLNDNALGLCLKFKTLDDFDRKEVFEKLEILLPDCPTRLGENNESTYNFDEAVQRMRYEDLLELLGEPDEAHTDGKAGYFLTEDESYKVTFVPDAQGNMACRYYEGDS